MSSKTPDWAGYVRPDEIAECWDGVSDVPGLYESLWGLMSEVPPIPNLEDSGPADHVGHGCLAPFWARLSEEHQVALDRLHEENVLGDDPLGDWHGRNE